MDTEQRYTRAEQLARNTIGATDKTASQAAFDDLIGFLAETGDKQLAKHINGFLYLEIDDPLRLPPSWGTFVGTFGEDFVEELAREGILAIKMRTMQAVERDPLAVLRALRQANIL